MRQQLFGARGAGRPDDLRIRSISCEVIGTARAKGQAGFGQDQDDVVLMPIKRRAAALHRQPQHPLHHRRARRCGRSTARCRARSRTLLRERRRIAPASENNFNVRDTKQIAETLQGRPRILTALLGAVAAVSLLVGGIGIMNIMLVSVTERTREIGIRLAIGALASEVLMQFLVEAVVLRCSAA